VGVAASHHVYAEAAVSATCHYTFAPTYWGSCAILPWMQQTHSRLIAILVALLAVTYCFYQRHTYPTVAATMSSSPWKFVAQRGFFTHDDDPESWDFRATTQPGLGLRTRSYPSDNHVGTAESDTQWPRFQNYVRYLNIQNPETERYKLLYIIRHGQGVHNVKETEVGRDEWNVRRFGSTAV
jgi:hypothetical protein